mgnify:CR=1 FL=1
MNSAFPCFKAYDIRGRVPDDLSPDLAHDIGRAYIAEIQPKSVVVGRDMRLESPQLAASLIVYRRWETRFG